MSELERFQFPTIQADAWLDALIERQADAATHPEFAGVGYINASAFSWNAEDLSSLPEILDSAQTCGAIVGPAPLWGQLRLQAGAGAPMLRVGISMGAYSITNKAEISFHPLLRTSHGARAQGTWVLVWTLGMILREANVIWRRSCGETDFADQDMSRAVGGEARTATDPFLRGWAVNAVQALVEVRAGRRTVRQLGALAQGRALADINRWARPGKPPMVVSSVHVSQTSPTVAEVAVILTGGGQGRAIALRLEATGGRWRIVTIASDESRGT